MHWLDLFINFSQTKCLSMKQLTLQAIMLLDYIQSVIVGQVVVQPKRMLDWLSISIGFCIRYRLSNISQHLHIVASGKPLVNYSQYYILTILCRETRASSIFKEFQRVMRLFFSLGEILRHRCFPFVTTIMFC